MTSEPYNEQVRASFENPVHAGDAEGDYALLVSASAAEPASGAHLVLSAGIEDGKIAVLRFRAWGCPHLIAAAELTCAELQGQPVGDLVNVKAARLMEKLSVPLVKTGRIFLLEDAAGSLHRQIGRQ